MAKDIVNAVITALKSLGGKAHYRDITQKIIDDNLYDFSKTNKPDHTVSKTLQINSLSTDYGETDIFYSVYGVKAKKGIWALVDSNSKVENKYYCEFSDFEMNNNKEDEDIADDKLYKEGKIKLETHKKYERNQTLVRDAKKLFKDQHGGKVYCEICGFDFSEVYGEIGEDFIEAHHKAPVSLMEEDDVTKIEDLIMVCSNCHRMIHRKLPWMSIDELKQILSKNNKKN